MTNSYPEAAPRKSIMGFKIALFLLASVYLLNCISPLRLHVDMLRYFAIKDCIELGCPADSAAAKDYLPFGYTALLLALSKINLLHSWSIVFINCLFLFGALYWVRDIYSVRRYLYFSFVLILLNWTTIKFITHPLSEMQYLFFSVGCLKFFYDYSLRKNLLSLLMAVVFAVLAFFTRSVGIALVAALVVSMIWLYRKELGDVLRKNKIIVGGIVSIIIGVVILARQLGLEHYTGVFTKQFDEGVSFSGLLKWHFTEWAEISLNTSLARVEGYIPGGLGETAFALGGIFFFGCFLYLVFIRKNQLPFIVKAYLLLYSVLLFNWPFYDPRFWVPLIPLIIPPIVEGLQSVRFKPAKMLITLFLLVYIAEGVLSVGYISYTSLNKQVFARTQASGVYKNEYETAFFGKPLSDTAKSIDPAALSVIKRYN